MLAVAAAVVTAAVAAVAAAVAAVVTAAALAAAVAVAAAAVVVVTAVAVAATKQLPEFFSNQKRAFGPFFVVCRNKPDAKKRRMAPQPSVKRRLRGRPDNTLSNIQLGKSRKPLATQPICQGITRYVAPARMAANALSAKTSAGIKKGMA